MSWSQAVLILAGHGSTLHPDSSAPTYAHADEIRHRKLFAEVHEAFWKEEPHYRDVLRQVESDVVYIVPFFIGHGYFTEKVLPREFGLSGPVSKIGGRKIYYCPPIGTHPGMMKVLLQRAHEVVAGEVLDPHETCLFLVGHGTSLDENSSEVVRRQATGIREKGIYGDCQAGFIEEEPYISRWKELTEFRNVIVVPFFLSDGLHALGDIPGLLGMPDETARHATVDGRRIWYARAIGTERKMADVILAQAKEFDETQREISKVA